MDGDRRRYYRRACDRPRKRNMHDRMDRHAAISVIAFLLLVAVMFMTGEQRSARLVVEKVVEAVAAATMDLIFGLFRGGA